jgi:hypothetical protein
VHTGQVIEPLVSVTISICPLHATHTHFPLQTGHNLIAIPRSLLKRLQITGSNAPSAYVCRFESLGPIKAQIKNTASVEQRLPDFFL